MRRLAGLQLQLGQQGEVVRGDVRVRAARDAVVHQPLAVQRPQQAQDAQVGLGVEDVVDDTLQWEEGAEEMVGVGKNYQFFF